MAERVAVERAAEEREEEPFGDVEATALLGWRVVWLEGTWMRGGWIDPRAGGRAHEPALAAPK